MEAKRVRWNKENKRKHRYGKIFGGNKIEEGGERRSSAEIYELFKFRKIVAVVSSQRL